MIPEAFHLAILRIASVLVPATRRADWLAEWRSELWQVRSEPCGYNATAFCMGAFRDAYWLCRNDPHPDRALFFAESPGRCLASLALLGALCVAMAFVLPAARKVMTCALYPRNVVMLTAGGNSDPYTPNSFFHPYPSVSWGQFKSLKSHRGEEFSALAFYVPTQIAVKTPRGTRTLLVARTTADLFRLLNIPVKSEIPGWNLPGNVDAFLIADETALRHTKGFAVARLRYDSLLNRRFSFIRLADRSFDLLASVLGIFLFACLLVGLMALGSQGRRPRGIGPRRGLFLAAKALLTLPIVMFGSLDVVSLAGPVSPLFFDIALFASVVAVRWILADQRKRCPVCLRLLANPVRVGESSRILLEWHGTELMCLRGHGLLYVPEWPEIWSGRQRWLGLGPSWGGLFP